MKKILYIIFILYSASYVALAQDNTQKLVIKGKITDEVNQGLPGVTILIKDTNVGTATDLDGNYSLSVPDGNKILVISFVGYVSREIPIENRSVIDVKLEPKLQTLDEVVVVGYGVQKKITLTGAVSTITGTELNQNPSASLQNSLAGRLPGFVAQQQSGMPGSDGAQFFIRGQSSYNNNNQPLIIVDDIEFTYEQFARLDPHEIQSISILKDASTTSIYGIKGANGVLVVTTTRGKIGTPKVDFRIERAMMQPTIMPKFLDSYHTALLYNQAKVNDGQAPYFTDADLDHYATGDDPYGHPNVNWKKELFKNYSNQYKSNLDISGGTEKVKYFVSVGYLSQDGMLKDFGENRSLNSNYYHKRYNYRSNLDMSVNKNLDLRLDLFGNIGETNKPSVGSPFGYNDVFYDYCSFLTLAPFAYPIRNPNGSFGYSTWEVNQGSYNVNNIIGRLTYYGYDRTFENNMNLVASANQKLNFITQGLSLKGTLSYASTHSYMRSMKTDQFPSFIYNPADSSYTPRDANIYRVRRFFLTYPTSGKDNATTRKLNVQAILDYDRTFGNHHVSGLALINQTSYMGYNAIGTYNFVPNNFRGYSGRLGYDYKQKYLFQLNGAYNGSDRFAKNHRYGFFPAVSLGWNISEEPFVKNSVPFMDRLKLRGSYGLVGNDKLGDNFTYYYEQAYTTSGGASFGYTHNAYGGYREGTLANNNVTWEKEKKFDVGLELGFFNSKVSFTADYFNNDRYDIMTTRGTVSAVFGQGLPPVNIGKVNNKGYELELTVNESIGKNFSFLIKGNYSYAKNKILYQDEPTPDYPYQAYTGHSIGQIKVYKSIGFYKDVDDIAKNPTTSVPARPGDLKYADLNGDNLITDKDMAYLGYPNVPNTNFGLQLGARYKNFSFEVLFQGARNFNVRGLAESIQAFSSNLRKIHQQSWTPELGDKAKFPILSFAPGLSSPGGYPSTFWLVSGDYLRLKTAEVSYILPAVIAKKIKATSIRLYVNGFNLYTWSKIFDRYDFDPEIKYENDRVNYPPQRTFNMGIAISF